MCDTSSHVFVVINIIPEGGAHGSFFVFTPLYGRYPGKPETPLEKSKAFREHGKCP
jgi:hypothetical protein